MSDDNEDENTDFADKTSIMQSDTFKLRLAEAGKAPPSLVLLVGPASSVGRQWPLEDTDRIIGRSPNAHIYVDDKSVSKSHAKVLLEGGDVSLMDLESTNKTVINGRLMTPLSPIRLANNDQIKCGNVIFKFLEQGNLETVASAQTYGRSQTDALTGIANRGALDLKAPEAFKRSGLLGIPLSLIAFDIDHFKKVNDTHGHPAGDFILQEIARVIGTRLIRGNDFFSRTGGEEFTLVLLGSNLQTAEEVGERIRQTIESHNFIFEGQEIPITISAGVAIKTEADSGWEMIYERADKALYHSKNSGRNQVSVAE